MNSKIRIVLAGAACMAAIAVIRAQSQPAAAPQANSMALADNQMVGAPPSRDYVWMSGHWNSEAGQWKWEAGHWDLPPNRNAVWVAGHWIQGSTGWTWMNGAWNVAEVPQSPSAPPMPPGQNVAQGGAQGVPMPSGPAPDVEGQYAPGGQVPVAYQGQTETDYPPADYSVSYPGYSYPGYYWNGDAWAWGFYPGPFAVGFGWGPRFGGFGGGYYRGGYFRGARGGFVRGAAHAAGHFR
jgi:hypothetical protein